MLFKRKLRGLFKQAGRGSGSKFQDQTWVVLARKPVFYPSNDHSGTAAGCAAACSLRTTMPNKIQTHP